MSKRSIIDSTNQNRGAAVSAGLVKVCSAAVLFEITFGVAYHQEKQVQWAVTEMSVQIKVRKIRLVSSGMSG